VSTFVVTGAAGFIGSHLSEDLLSGGHSVIGIDSFTDYYERGLKERNLQGSTASERFRLLEVDLSTVDLSQIFAGVDGVFHLAAQPGVRGSWGDTFAVYLRDNVLATQRVFEAAAQLKVRVVYASSSSIYGDAESYPTPESTPPMPRSPYGITKLTCEHLARAFVSGGLDAIGLRYFTVYGPRQRPDMAFTRIARAVLTGGTFTIFGTGAQSRDVTYVADAVSASRAIMERGRSGAV
jgi:UDP-glucuronate 4-epimerase